MLPFREFDGAPLVLTTARKFKHNLSRITCSEIHGSTAVVGSQIFTFSLLQKYNAI